MWADAQRYGRPATYRWRPLRNSVIPFLVPRRKVWLTPAAGVPCSTRHSSSGRIVNLLGCPKLPGRSQPLVGRRSPYCRDMWGRYCCLTGFSDCRYNMPQLRRYSPTKLCDGAQMASFCVIFASCIFSELRAALFRHAF